MWADGVMGSLKPPSWDDILLGNFKTSSKSENENTLYLLRVEGKKSCGEQKFGQKR